MILRPGHNQTSWIVQSSVEGFVGGHPEQDLFKTTGQGQGWHAKFHLLRYHPRTVVFSQQKSKVGGEVS